MPKPHYIILVISWHKRNHNNLILNMKHFFTLLLAIIGLPLGIMAQGWPANYGGVMLQGFYWDSYDYSQWSILENQASDMKGYIDLIWVPQSGKCLETTQVMGYAPYYYFDHNSSFGTEAQLRSMIKTLKANGIGTIADVVVNHHQTNGWFGFPKETYNGVIYQFQSTDIVANDDKGKAATQAKTEGVSLSSNNDEGEDWDGCRDLDHKSSNVQSIIKAYVKYLKNDLGYTGFRYDMVKGFSGTHVADYNDEAGIEYSVGEYWDSNAKIENWINTTNKKSAAFDFQFRYNVRDAINNNNWTKLNSTNNLMHDPNYRQYAVTFVENHDTEYRSVTEQQDPIKKDTLAANAYLLAMPGTPCIFLPHWRAYKQELKSMIEARKLAGITNMSNYSNKLSSTVCYANETTGDKAKLIAVVGNNKQAYTASSDYTKILDGYHYCYYIENSIETAWCNKASGEYVEGFKATLIAASKNSNAKLVYTTDGTDPTAKSTQVASGSNIDITNSCTLKVGLLVNGAVSGIRTYEYDIKAFEPYTITVYVNADNTTWNKVNFYYWSNMTDLSTYGWPGETVTDCKTINGKKWYYKDFTISQKDGLINFVFCNETGKSQTHDKTGINKTTYLEIGSLSSGKYTVNDVTDQITSGITNAVISDKSKEEDNSWYTLSGMKITQKPSQSGIYIHQGKKVVVK